VLKFPSGLSSANSRGPFFVSTDRRIKKGDMVLIELDTYADGYWSDLTRTYVAGEPSPKQREIWDTVLLAEQRAMDAVHGGIKALEIDAIARSTIEEEGYGRYFLHWLGHGVGLAFHEPSTLHPASEDFLLSGMTHAVEPSICIPGARWVGRYEGRRQRASYVKEGSPLVQLSARSLKYEITPSLERFNTK